MYPVVRGRLVRLTQKAELRRLSLERRYGIGTEKLLETMREGERKSIGGGKVKFLGRVRDRYLIVTCAEYPDEFTVLTVEVTKKLRRKR